MKLKLLLILVLSSMAVIFIVQNSVEVVQVSFLYWRASLSSALLIFFTLMIGFVLGWFLHSYLLYRKSRKDEFVYLR